MSYPSAVATSGAAATTRESPATGAIASSTSAISPSLRWRERQIASFLADPNGAVVAGSQLFRLVRGLASLLHLVGAMPPRAGRGTVMGVGTGVKGSRGSGDVGGNQ